MSTEGGAPAGLAGAVLSAAGWEAEDLALPGWPGPLRVWRYANAHATLHVGARDDRHLALLVQGRLPLLIPTVAGSAEERQDRAAEVLRLVIEWQDRLGRREADAAFWRALIAARAVGLVLKDGAAVSTLDWSRLDETGEPQDGYLLACACQGLSGRPQDADPSLLQVVRSVVHAGWSGIFCRCLRCGRRWKVEEDAGYHFPLWNWSDVTHSGEHAADFD